MNKININKLRNTGSTRIVNNNGIPYIEFTPFDRFDWLKLAFSTRLGGVSTGFSESMNFTFDRGDSKSNVIKNFNLFTNAIEISADRCVCTKQTHTANVLKVSEKMAGMGITRERDYTDIDGLVTNERNLCLVTAFADCVPVYFVDSKNRCIGASHSGWRGTISDITHNTLALMNKEYNTKASDVYAFIGPSICMNCYEVDYAVFAQFEEKYKNNHEYCEAGELYIDKGDGKYLLNLSTANYYNMINAGIKPQNIGITDICTCCNPDLLFSHRKTNGKRGVLCGFMYIK